MGVAATVVACGRGRSAHRNDPAGSPRLPRNLWGTASAGRAAARTPRPRREETGGPSDASRPADRGLPPSQASRLEARHGNARGSRETQVPRRCTRPALVLRHHTTSGEGGLGLLRCGHRRVLPPDCGLVDQRPDHCGDRRRRPRDGALAAKTRTGNRCPCGPRSARRIQLVVATPQSGGVGWFVVSRQQTGRCVRG